MHGLEVGDGEGFFKAGGRLVGLGLVLVYVSLGFGYWDKILMGLEILCIEIEVSWNSLSKSITIILNITTHLPITPLTLTTTIILRLIISQPISPKQILFW